MASGSYGRKMAAICGSDEAPVVKTRQLRNSAIIATRLVIDCPGREKTAPLGIEDAFIAAVTFQPNYSRESWIEGRSKPLQLPQPAGSVSLMDLRLRNEARFLSPINSVQFYFPKAALDSIAEANEISKPQELRSDLCWLFHEPVLAELGRSLMPAFAAPEEASPIFIDHVLMASALHLMTKHAGASPTATTYKGGLTPWQQRRVTEMLDSNPSEALSLECLARSCELSVRHFTRAFAQTNGMPPHQWMLNRRIERAKQLMLASGLSIEEVAQTTMFANQSHFTRVFSRLVGESPGAWRRIRAA